MERAVDEGLVRSIGLSNFSPEKTDKWLKDARIKPAVNQVSSTSFRVVSSEMHGFAGSAANMERVAIAHFILRALQIELSGVCCPVPLT